MDVKKETRYWLILSAVCMIFVALMRGMGGVLLLLKQSDLDTGTKITASQTGILLVGAGLIIIALMFIISAIGVLRLRYFFWKLGIVTTILFIIEGAVNGLVLYGRPLEAGTLINISAAAVILLLLFMGRNAVQAYKSMLLK